MKQFSIFNFQFSIKKGFTPHHYGEGFTIIELIIVFSVIAIISTIGIASFQGYSKSQSLKTAALTIKTLLQQARSQSSSQTNNCPSVNTFRGYAVEICCLGGGSQCPPNCSSGNNYELDTICSSTYTTVSGSGGKLPSGVTVDNQGTTQRSFQFIPITGGVMQGGTIMLDGANNSKQTITVSGAGIIQ